ncbi:MAG TPA: hypothetical protein V6D33_16495 [Cyanophyceae cyanobacterium]
MLKGHLCNAFLTVDFYGVIEMSRRYNHNHSPLEKIVYTKVNVNGKIELVQLELYADGSVKRAD